MQSNLKIIFIVLLLTLLPTSLSAQTEESKKSTNPSTNPPEQIDGKNLKAWIHEMTSSSDPAVRVRAVQVIPLFREAAAAAAPYMAKRLSIDKDVSLRANLALALQTTFVREEDIPEIVKALVDRLSLKENQLIVCYYAAQTLGRFDSKARPAIAALIKATHTPDYREAARAWEIRRAAIVSLGRIAKGGKKDAFAVIVKAILHSLETDHCSEIRLSATKILTELGKEGDNKQKSDIVEQFRKHLNYPDKAVAVWAHVGLVKLDPPGTKYLDALAKFLKADELDARTNAIQGLVELGELAKSKVPDLIQALQDKETLVVSMACWALGEIGLKTKLSNEPSLALRKLAATPKLAIGVRQEIIASLKKIEKQEQPSEDEAKAIKKLWEEYRKNLKPKIDKLVSIGGKELDQWKKEIIDKDPSIRDKAIRISPYFGSDSRDVVPNMLKVLQKDKDVTVCVSTLCSLSGIQVADRDVGNVVKILEHRLRNDSQSIVRYNAAVALGGFGKEARAAVPELILATRDAASWEIRKMAMQSLTMVARDPDAPPDRDVVTAMIRGLNDKCADVRLAATMGLGALGAKPDSPEGLRIARAFQKIAAIERNPMVAIWAYVGLMAMDKVNDKRLEEIAKFLKYKKKPLVRVSAARAFGVMGKESKPHLKDLAELLDDVAPQVVGSACWALGEIGMTLGIDSKTVAMIKKIGDDKSKPEGLREIAKEAIKKINGEIKPGK